MCRPRFSDLDLPLRKLGEHRGNGSQDTRVAHRGRLPASGSYAAGDICLVASSLLLAPPILRGQAVLSVAVRCDTRP